MTNEISQEAKTALAEVCKRKARQRLHRDGADSTPAMRRRIQAFAMERAIPSAKIAKLMKGRTPLNHFIAFCKEYDVNCDWLMDGDLRGLFLMTKKQKAAEAIDAEAQRKQIIQLFNSLPPRLQAVAVIGIRAIIERGQPRTYARNSLGSGVGSTVAAGDGDVRWL
jgi:hypothetical protein